MDKTDERDLAYLIVAGAAVAVAVRIWSTTVKPWAASTFELGRGDELVTIGGLVVSTTDLVGVGLILGPVLICLYLIRRKIKTVKRNRKQLARERARVSERDRSLEV